MPGATYDQFTGLWVWGHEEVENALEELEDALKELEEKKELDKSIRAEIAINALDRVRDAENNLAASSNALTNMMSESEELNEADILEKWHETNEQKVRLEEKKRDIQEMRRQILEDELLGSSIVEDDYDFQPVRKETTLPKFKQPDYGRVHLKIIDPSGNEEKLVFNIGPGNYQINYSENKPISKTKGGFFLKRMGSNLSQIGMSGILLDTKDLKEKHQFLSKYKEKIADKKTKYGYENDNTITLYIEGVNYIGVITNIGFDKAGQVPYRYRYSMQFMVLRDDDLNI